MRALGYLFITRLKNNIIDTLKRPSRLIMIVFFALIIGVSIFTGNIENHSGGYRDIGELYAIVLGFYFMVLMITLLNGLDRGASFFTMADVNLLFAAPVSSRSILLYGMLRQLGTIFFMAFFLLFQYSWMHMTYGIGFGALLLILVCYIGVIFCAQLAALVIYSLTNGNDKRRRIARVAVWATGAATLVVALFPYVKNIAADNSLSAIVSSANNSAVNYMPIAGWMRALFVGISSGRLSLILIGAIATALFIGGFLALLLGVHAEYYEDVLSATEASFSAITAKKEGRLSENAPNNVKLGKVGLGRGRGAWAFFFKHQKENRRASVFFIQPVNLIYYAAAIIFAFVFRDSIIPAYAMSLYFLFFESVIGGRWLKELLYPYIYMVPEPPFKKLIALSAESALKNAVLSVILVAILGVITNANPALVAVLALVRVCFSLLIMACNFLADRLFGNVSSKTLMMFLYILVILVTALPGAVLMIFLIMAAGEIVGLLAMALWLLLVSALITFLCRNILSYAELNHQ